MRKISEVSTIYKAFTDTILGKLPKKESDYPAWYKDRLEKCDLCKFNTKNIPNKVLPTSLYVSEMIGKHRCSICSCFIKQKTWMKSEGCSLGEDHEIPKFLTPDYLEGESMEPKWNRMAVITSDKDEFNLISTDEKLYDVDLSKDGGNFEIIFRNHKQGTDIDFDIIMETKGKSDISDVLVSCGCTKIRDKKKISDNKFIIFFHVKCDTWGEGKQTRGIKPMFRYSDGTERSIEIKMTINTVKNEQNVNQEESNPG